MKEIQFKLVPGFGGFYRMGSDGSVWTCRNGRWGKGSWRRLAVFPRKKDGYLQTTLTKNAKASNYTIHRLLLETFVGPCPPGKEARHFPDRNRSNNQLSNLSWATKKENQQDRILHGTDNQGERCGRSKLTWKDVEAIRKLAGGCWRPRDLEELAAAYNVSSMNISYIVREMTWKS